MSRCPNRSRLRALFQPIVDGLKRIAAECENGPRLDFIQDIRDIAEVLQKIWQDAGGIDRRGLGAEE